MVLASHLGRPKGKPDARFSLAPVAKTLQRLLDKDVIFAPDCIGSQVESIVLKMKDGDVVLLENLRYHPEEEKNDEEFSKKLAGLADFFINDAFGAAHRAHASTEGVCKYMKKCAACFLMNKELKFLGQLMEKPAKPFTAILGGAKVRDKIMVIENLLNIVDGIIIGGGAAAR